jgi:hypothetical protein
MDTWAYNSTPIQTLTVVLDEEESEVSSISSFPTMSGIDKVEQLAIIDSLASKMDKVKLSASQANSEVSGVFVSKDVLTVHNLLKEHRLVFEVETNPNGKWNWGGLHEIKNRGGATTNPNFKMPDGVSTYYGAVKYDYNVNIGTGTKAITHDVIAISLLFLDAKPRPQSKNPNAGVYGYDWSVECLYSHKHSYQTEWRNPEGQWLRASQRGCNH